MKTAVGIIDQKYYPSIAKSFSASVISEIACTGESEFLTYVTRESGLYDVLKRFSPRWTLRCLFEEIYDYLMCNYRCEYIYKNTIANNILIGRHSLNTATLLSEFRAGESKADVVILNGTSNVYEIKSEYDTINRLKNQLDSYLKIFDKVNVVTHSSQLEKVMESISEDVGIMVLLKKYTLRTIRHPTSNKKNVDPERIFESLRKEEYCKIVKDEYGFIPDVPNTRIFAESKKLFTDLSPERAHDKMVEVLRRRKQDSSFKRFIKAIPPSLRSACICSRLNSKQRNNFLLALDSFHSI